SRDWSSDVCSSDLEQPGDVPGIVLQVAIHRHDDLGASVVNTGRERCGLPKVASEADQPNSRVGGGEPAQAPEGAVRAAIIDEDELHRVAQHGGDPAIQLFHVQLLIEHGHDDGYRDSGVTPGPRRPYGRSTGFEHGASPLTRVTGAPVRVARRRSAAG